MDGEVAEADRERLWAHLFRCAPCLRRFREMEALAAATRRPAAPAPRYLRQRILAAVAHEAELPHRRPSRAPIRAALAGAVVVAIMVVVGLRPPSPGGSSVAPPGPVAQATGETVGAPVTPGPTAVAAVPSAPSDSGVAPETLETAVPAAATEPALPLPATGGWLHNLLNRTPAAPAVRAGAETRPQPAPAAPVPTPAAPEETPVVPSAAPVAASSPAVPAPAPAPAPGAPVVLAALPPAPAPAAPGRSATAAPAAPPPPSQPESVRQLLLTPVQSSSVVVYQSQPQDKDVSLAEASHSLNAFTRDQQRSLPHSMVVAR
jgi:hypothetical protein